VPYPNATTYPAATLYPGIGLPVSLAGSIAAASTVAGALAPQSHRWPMDTDTTRWDVTPADRWELAF